MGAVGCRSGEVEVVGLVGVHADRDRLPLGLDKVLWAFASTNLGVARGNRADRELDAGISDGRAGDGILCASAGVVGVVIIAVSIEALVVGHLPRARRDAERVEVARQVDRRRDGRGSGRSRG